ncbi:peptidoglycan DD-metalloendopeptidase family protein [bacterium SCSIO 12741]|nr:peptidoglycan DD-metalloendopeptidase family protein [bacterium SCSIO 12741]
MNLRYFQLLLIAFASLLLGTACQDDDQIADSSLPPVEEEAPVVHIEYGIETDSFKVVRGVINKNEMLSHILLQHHIPWPEIDRLVKRAKPVYDVRKLASGKSYTILCSQDSIDKAQYFIYDANAIDYVVFDLRDSMRVYKGQRDVHLVRKEVAGTIHSSLYETLMKVKASPALAMELSEIYAWSIDFYRIQKGDQFKVIYYDKYVEDTRVGVGHIEAALFQHRKEPFYAFPFDQDGQVAFFDQDGKSLRKAFLKAPLKFGRISSGYSNRRYHPVQKRWKAHRGTDYAAPTGTPILAVGDGVVIEARYKKFNGNYVKIKHNGTYTTQYLHMSKFAKGMKKGKYVRQGDVIGYVGSTGLATGPHVCFRFWKNGKQVDHRREKLPPSLPIKEAYKEQFEAHKDSMKIELDNIPFATDKEPELAGF